MAKASAANFSHFPYIYVIGPWKKKGKRMNFPKSTAEGKAVADAQGSRPRAEHNGLGGILSPPSWVRGEAPKAQAISCNLERTNLGREHLR